MSLWIKVQASFWAHRKTHRLHAALGDAAYWVPIRLWCYAAENQKDGDFSAYSAAEIASCIGYQDDADRMLEALLEARFLDPGPVIHGWAEHNGFHQTYQERAKKAAAARWSPPPKPPSPTPLPKEHKTEIERERETSIASSMPQASKPAGRPGSVEEVAAYAAALSLHKSEAEKFWDFYVSNGWKVGKNPMKDWRAALRNWQRNGGTFTRTSKPTERKETVGLQGRALK